MMDIRELTVRLKTVDGQWETVGADRLRGVTAEHFQATANRWGSDTCSFQLRRDPGAIQPDLSAFTRCQVWIAGLKCWSGRVKETPIQDGSDRVINVAGEGMQYHLDDDVYERYYVHTRLADWKDARSYPTTDLGFYTAAFQVNAGDGVITMSLPRDSTCPPFGTASVVLDFGSGGAKRIVVTWDAAGHANFEFKVIAADTPAGAGTGGNLDNAPLVTSDATVGLTFSTAHRYVELRMQDTGAGTTAADDTAWVRIKAATVFAATAYESGGLSALTADDIILDALDRGTLLLSADRSEIESGTVTLDEYALPGARSTRERVNDANAYENYETKVDVEDRMCFRPRPAAPTYEIGEWSGAEFQDASTNSGDEIYNRVLVQATGPDGNALSVPRASGELPTSAPLLTAVSSPAPTNPSADVNTTGWSVTAYTLSRSTTTVHTAPGSINWHNAPMIFSGQQLVADFAAGATFQRGLTYVASIAIRASSSGACRLRFGVNTDLTLTDIEELDYDFGVRVVNPIPTAVFNVYQVYWTPEADYSSSAVKLAIVSGDNGTFPTDIWADTVGLFRALATLPDRQGFVRTKILPIQSAITRTAGQRFGDLYLAAHRTTPFRGGFQATGQGGIRRVLGGGSVHPAWLLRDTGQLVRCSDRIDPDDGSWSRKGRIDTVSYDHDSITASVALDEDRAGFETLLARYAIIVDQRAA